MLVGRPGDVSRSDHWSNVWLSPGREVVDTSLFDLKLPFGHTDREFLCFLSFEIGKSLLCGLQTLTKRALLCGSPPGGTQGANV